MSISLSQAVRDCLNEEAKKDHIVKIHSPSHRFHGQEARVFHDYGDGRVNVQLRHGPNKSKITNLSLKKGEYTD